MRSRWVQLVCAFAAALAAVPAQSQPPHASAEDQRALLNEQQAQLARQQLEQNAANRRAFEQATQDRLIAIHREQAAYAERQAAYDAEKARLAHEHDEAMERWRADVAACKAGHTKRCAQK